MASVRLSTPPPRPALAPTDPLPVKLSRTGEPDPAYSSQRNPGKLGKCKASGSSPMLFITVVDRRRGATKARRGYARPRSFGRNGIGQGLDRLMKA